MASLPSNFERNKRSLVRNCDLRVSQEESEALAEVEDLEFRLPVNTPELFRRILARTIKLRDIKAYLEAKNFNPNETVIITTQNNSQQSVSLLRFARICAVGFGNTEVFNFLLDNNIMFTPEEMKWEFGYLCTCPIFSRAIEKMLAKDLSLLQQNYKLYYRRYMSGGEKSYPSISIKLQDLNNRGLSRAQQRDHRTTGPKIVRNFLPYFFMNVPGEPEPIYKSLSPLHCAFMAGNRQTVELLLKFKIDLYVTDSYQEMAICQAGINQNQALISLFLEAHKNHPDPKEKAEEVQLQLDLMLARAKRNINPPRFIEFLRQQGAKDRDIKDPAKGLLNALKEEDKKQMTEAEKQARREKIERAIASGKEAKVRRLAEKRAEIDRFLERFSTSDELGDRSVETMHFDASILAATFETVMKTKTVPIQKLSLTNESYTSALQAFESSAEVEKTLDKLQKMFVLQSKEYIAAETDQRLQAERANVQHQNLETLQQISDRLAHMEDAFTNRDLEIVQVIQELPEALAETLSKLNAWKIKVKGLDFSTKQQRIIKKCDSLLRDLEPYDVLKIDALKVKNQELMEVFRLHYENDRLGAVRCHRNYTVIGQSLSDLRSKLETGDKEKINQEIQMLELQQQAYLKAGNDIFKRLNDCQEKQFRLLTELNRVLKVCDEVDDRIASGERVLFVKETVKEPSEPISETAIENEAQDLDNEETQQEKKQRQEKYLKRKERQAHERKENKEQELSRAAKTAALNARITAITENDSHRHLMLVNDVQNARIVDAVIKTTERLHQDALKVFAGIVLNDFDADELALERDGIYGSISALMQLSKLADGKLMFTKTVSTHFRDGIWHSLELYRQAPLHQFDDLRRMKTGILKYLAAKQPKTGEALFTEIDSQLFRTIVNFGKNSRDETVNFNFQLCLVELESLSRRLQRLEYLREELKPFRAMAEKFLIGRLSSFYNHAKRLAKDSSESGALQPYQVYEKPGNAVRHANSDTQLAAVLLLSQEANQAVSGGSVRVSSAASHSEANETKSRKIEM